MTTNAAQKTEPDDGLTPGERAYMNGGDVEGLKKEGLEIADAPATPAPSTEPPAADPAAAAAAAEPAEPDDDEPELDPATNKPKKKGGWISKRAFDAEREERKRLSQELGTTKEQWARLEERFKVFQEAALASAPADDPPAEQPLPDPEQDVFGYLKAVAAREEKRYSALEQRLGQVNETTQARDESSNLVTTYSNDARRFAQVQPDFGAAYTFLIAQRDAELAAAGYDDPAERSRLIVADEQAIVRKSLQGKKSPAETVYGLAKARGYVVAAPAAEPAPAPAPATPAAPGGAPAAAAPAKPTAAEEIARVQKGQDASLSLSNVGGNRPQNMTITDLVSMNDEEFRAFARKNPNLLEQMAGK